MYVMKAILILGITDDRSGNNFCVDSNGEQFELLRKVLYVPVLEAGKSNPKITQYAV